LLQNRDLLLRSFNRRGRRFVAGQTACIGSESRWRSILAPFAVVALRTTAAYVGDFHPYRTFRNLLKRHGMAIAAGKRCFLHSFLPGIHRKMPDMGECDRVHTIQGNDDIGGRHRIVRESQTDATASDNKCCKKQLLEEFISEFHGFHLDRSAKNTPNSNTERV
jgi:hypothetical protein